FIVARYACSMTHNAELEAGSSSVFIRSALPMLIISVWGMMSLTAIFTDTGQELYLPKSLESWSYVIGTGLGLLCLVRGLRQRPLNFKLATTTVIFSILTAAICSMMTLGVLLRIREAIVFRGDHLVTYGSELRVWSASISHGRGGPNYNIVLRDYPGMFQIPENDYLLAFGAVERLHPDGYCLRMIVQRAGKAARFIANDGYSLPGGSLQRCPASVG
ncbi:hypothetical protein, partial [Sphingomonas sp. TF3]|uniref:hypothetical protein n=1 Tax=Sphingomonas sp. TF3 TaxID=2495580 RepID=UPI001C8D2D50